MSGIDVFLFFFHFSSGVSWFSWWFHDEVGSSKAIHVSRHWILGRERWAPKWRGSADSSWFPGRISVAHHSTSLKTTSDNKVSKACFKIYETRISTWYIYIYNIRIYIYIYRCFKMNQSLMISPCIHHIRTPKFWRSERQMIGALKIPVGRHLACGQGCGCRLSYPHGCVVKF